MCKKLLQQLFVKFWASLDQIQSMKSLAITAGILRITHAAKQECDDGTWILADTGATDDPVALMKGQGIRAGTRPCKLQLAIGHVGDWASADGLVKIVTQSCQVFPNLQSHC